MDKKLIGVDLGGTTIKFAILTQDGEVQQKWSIKTNILDEGSHIVPDIIESINHHLGLYEMNPEQLWETTMNPETRILKQVSIENAAEADYIFSMLMGDDVAPRREFIEKHATYANIDA